MTERLLTRTETSQLMQMVFDDVETQIIDLIKLHAGDWRTRHNMLNQLDVLSTVRDKCNARLEHGNPLTGTD
jgi:hypothetical protein